jgi:superfamily II DNA or RNA helicase
MEADRQLRNYQIDALDAIMNDFELGLNALVSMPTSTGKTFLFAHVIRLFLARGKRVLVLVHRAELGGQAQKEIRNVCGIESGIEKAEIKSNGEPVIIASVQSLQKVRLAAFDPSEFGLVVADEAHHIPAASWQNIFEHFNSKTRTPILGVSATLARSDGAGYANYFKRLTFQYSLADAMHEGYCVKLHRLTPNLELDLSGLTGIGNEIPADKLEPIVVDCIGPIAESIATLAGKTRFMGFMPRTASARLMADILGAKYGIAAAAIAGKDEHGKKLDTEERSKLLSDFEDGKITHLLTCDLLKEGVNIQPANAVGIIRSVKNAGSYMQMVGRVTRPHPGKDHALLMDFSPRNSKLKLANPYNLFATEKVPQEAIRIAQELEAKTELLDYREILKRALEIYDLKHAVVKRKWNGRPVWKVDPIKFARLDDPGDQLLQFWSREKREAEITKGQIGYLGLMGFDTENAASMTRGEASRIISQCEKERPQNKKGWAFDWIDGKRKEYGL